MSVIEKNNRLPLLDLLRFVAAFSVMLMHLLQRGFANDRLYDYSFSFFGSVFKYNYLAVNFFFMISGYVILLTAQNRTVIQFVCSRFLRLYPAYWIACTVSFIVSYYYLMDVRQATFARYIANMTMLNGFFDIGYIDGVFWTLFVELKFYLLTMVIIYSKLIRKPEKVLWVWLLLSIANLYFQNKYLTSLLLTDYSSFFCIGAMFYVISNDGFKLGFMRCLFFVIAFFVSWSNETQTLQIKSEHLGVPFSSLSLLFILLAMNFALYWAIKVTNIPHHISNLFQNLGKASYPLYLIHFNISLTCLHVFASDGSNRYVIAFLCIFFMPIIAYFFAIYCEDPLRRILKQFISNRLGLTKF